MNKPTQKQITAVKKTVIMWSWLRDHPTKNKDDYFDAHKRIKNIPRNECYLCECLGCREDPCPLYVAKLNRGCCDDGQPFDLWTRAQITGRTKEATKQAQRLINQCERWLKKYDKS